MIRKEKNIENINFDVISKETLKWLELLNPCEQVYYCNDEALFILYKQKMDLFNFLKGVSLKVKMPIVGLPFSVSEKGYYGQGNLVKSLMDHVKGLKIILNGDDDLNLPKALTLPTYIFENRFESFETYLMAMRSHYRYRIKKAQTRGNELEFNPISQIDFNYTHYSWYRDVYNHSSDQLELLSVAFFQQFPSEIVEIVLEKHVVGFYQVVQRDEELVFIFGGFDRALQKSHDIYLNLLLSIIKLGIDRGCKTINFGQTAGDSKQKIGCVEVDKYLYIHHPSKVIMIFCQLILPLLSYKKSHKAMHVFKGD